MQIHAAAASGNLPCLRRQVARGVPVDVRGHDGKTALMFACDTSAGVSVLQCLLEYGADPNAVCESLGHSPLMSVSTVGGWEKIQCLVAAGADAAYASPAGYNALYRFLHHEKEDNLKAIELLIRQGCDPNLVSDYNESPLRVAIHCGNAAAARLLINGGADRKIAAMSPLGWAVLLGTIDDVLVQLESDADLEFEGHSRMTPWLLAVAIGDQKKAECLHQAGVSLQARGRFGKPPLHYAAEQNVDGWSPLMYAPTLESVEVLLRHDARLDLTDDVGTNVIGRRSDPEILDRLLRATSDLRLIQDGLDESLRRSAEHGSLESVKTLLDRGADVNASTSWGQTPLMEAAEHSHVDVVRHLIKVAANLEAIDDKGRTAIFHAAAPESLISFQIASENNSDWLDQLESLESDGHQLDSPSMEPTLSEHPFGYLPSDDSEVVNVLADADANLEATDNEGMTPLLVACHCGRPARVEALIRLILDHASSQ